MAPGSTSVANTICHALERVRFAIASEDELQSALDIFLRGLDLPHPVHREVALTKHDRIDFLCGDVGIEVKCHGSLSTVLRQLTRYAKHPRIGILILVTSRWQLMAMPAMVNQKLLLVQRVGQL